MEHPFSAIYREAQRESAHKTRGGTRVSIGRAFAFNVASELARRHAGYGLYWDDKFKPPPTAPLHLRRSTKPVVFLPRDGRVGSLDQTHGFMLEPTGILAFASPPEPIEAIGSRLGLASPRHSLPTDRHNIMYRTMAHILASTAYDDADWTLAADTPFAGAGRAWAAKIPTNDADDRWASGVPWTLLRDDEPWRW
jgi:hypothetical protein